MELSKSEIKEEAKYLIQEAINQADNGDFDDDCAFTTRENLIDSVHESLNDEIFLTEFISTSSFEEDELQAIISLAQTEKMIKSVVKQQIAFF